MHVHVGGLGVGASGISVSPRFRRSIPFRALMREIGVGRADRERADELYVERLAGFVREARTVDAVVALALDGAWRDGELDRRRSPLVVPNAWVRQASHRHPELLFGASVNPTRPDALDELERVLEDGAVLMKWLPNVMGFDPADPRVRPFLRRLAEAGLPLLTHCGAEFTLPGGRAALGDPLRLLPALDEGVSVIAAHCGTLCRVRLPDGERVSGREAIARLVQRYPNLHADLAALASPLRGWALRWVLDDPRLAPRLVEASDFPVPTWPVTQLGRVRWAVLREAGRLANPFDRDREVKRAAGVTEEMTTRAAGLLRLAPPVRARLDALARGHVS